MTNGGVPTSRLFILLPPSEGKSEGGAGRWRETSGTFGRRLGRHRGGVLDALGRTTLTEAKLGARGALYERATAANAAAAQRRTRARPAWQRYTGVVWEHLRPHDLDDEQRARVLVPSALLGLLTGIDPVPDHRLKFDATLDGIGRLDRFWRPLLTSAVKHHVRPADTLVELLPQEHRAALDLHEIARRRQLVRVEFHDKSGHDAKADKGALARQLLLRGIDALDDFAVSRR